MASMVPGALGSLGANQKSEQGGYPNAFALNRFGIHVSGYRSPHVCQEGILEFLGRSGVFDEGSHDGIEVIWHKMRMVGKLCGCQATASQYFLELNRVTGMVGHGGGWIFKLMGCENADNLFVC